MVHIHSRTSWVVQASNSSNVRSTTSSEMRTAVSKFSPLRHEVGREKEKEEKEEEEEEEEKEEEEKEEKA